MGISQIVMKEDGAELRPALSTLDLIETLEAERKTGRASLVSHACGSNPCPG